MPALTDGAERAMNEAKAKATAAAANFNKLRTEVQESGADLSATSDAFKLLDDADRTRSASDAAAVEATQHYMRMVEMEGGSLPTHAEGFNQAPTATRRNIDPATAVMESAAYGEIKDILQRSGKAGIGGNRSLGEAMNRDQFRNALVTGGSDTSGGAFTENDRQAYVDIPGRPVGLMGWVTVGSTDSDLVDYVRLNARPSSAGFVNEATTVVGGAEDGLKPEGSLSFEVVTAAVQTIAELVPVTRRAFSDAGQLRTIIDQLLSEDLRRGMEQGMYSGTGTSPAFRGILNTAGINTVAFDAAVPLEQLIRKGMTQIRLDFEEPDYIAMNPLDAEKLAFRRGNDGGAQTGAYLIASPTQGGIPTLWGKPVVEDAMILEGRVLIGTKNAATLWVREGANVMVSDSHKDWFQRNVLALLAEARAAFGVQRPSAFADVDILA